MVFRLEPPNTNPMADFDVETDEFDAAAEFRDHKTRSSEVLKYGVQAALVGAFDTIGQSINAIDDEESVTNWLQSQEGLENFSEFYRENREGAQLAGEIATSLVPIFAATKVIRVGSMLDKALDKVRHGEQIKKFVLSSGKGFRERLDTRMEDFKLFAAQGQTAISPGSKLSAAIREESLGAAGDMLKETIAADLAILALYNDSDVFFEEDKPLTNFLMFAVPDALFVGAAFKGTQIAMRRHIQNTVGPEVAKQLNKLGLQKTDVLSRESLRGVPMTVAAIDHNSNAALLAKEGVENATTREFANGRIQAAISDFHKEANRLATDNVYKQSTNAIKGTHPTRQFVPSQEELKTLREAGFDDPSLLIPLQGLDEASPRNISNYEKEVRSLVKQYNNEIAKQQKAGDPDSIIHQLTQERDKLVQHSRVVLEIDNSLTPLSERVSTTLDRIHKLPTVSDKNGMIQFTRAVQKETGVEMGMDRSGNALFKLPKSVSEQTVLGTKRKNLFSVNPAVGKNLEPSQRKFLNAMNSQDIETRATTWGLMQKQIQNFEPGTDVIRIEPGSHFTKVDMAIELIKKHHEVDPNTIVKLGAQEVGNAPLTKQELRDTLEFLSLEQKLPEYAKLKMAQVADTMGVMKLPKSKQISDYTIAQYLNMPSPTSVGPHPIMQVFHDLIPPTGGQLPNLRAYASHMGDIRARMVSNVTPDLLGAPIRKDLELNGTVLNFRNDGTKAPVILSLANSASRRIDASQINDVISATKMAQNSAFAAADPERQAIIKTVFDHLMSQEARMLKVGEVNSIIDLGATGGTTTFRNFANRDSAVIKAADELADTSFKLANNVIGQKFAAENANFNKLFASNNSRSLNLFNIAVTQLRNGWDVIDEPVQIEAGKWALRLDPESERNRSLVRRFLNSDSGEVPEFMPVRTGGQLTTAVLDEVALNGLTSATKLSHGFLDELNYIRQIRGKPQINKRAWHVPYVNVLNRERLYLQDNTGKVVQPVYGHTFAEVSKEAKQGVANAAKRGETLTIVSEKSAKAYNDNFLQTWEQTENFSFAGKQTGGRSGKGVGEEIELGEDGLKDVIANLQANYDELVKYTMGTIFESELQYARTAKRAAAGVSGRQEAAKATKWDEFENTLLQKTSVDRESGLGKLYSGIEGFADDVLRKVWDEKNQFIKTANQVSDKEFAELNTFLGKELNPFNSVNDMIERTTKQQLPPTFRKFNTAMNRFTTNMVLRIFDLGMPLINFASLASVTPAVVAAMKRGKHESEIAWRSRVGILGSTINENDVVPNTARMVATGIHGMFSDEVRAATRLAAKKGLLNLQVAEDMERLTAPTRGYMGNLLAKGIDIASIPTDWSEKMSRQVAFSMMYNIGKRTMQLGDDAAVLFAHSHTNQIVGDYRPTNRPQMFQGATGMPLGLFTTWAWNFLQRVYGDVVDFRGNAVLAQAAMQQFMFGFQSMPGAETFINTFTTNYNGSENIVDSLDRKFGTAGTDLFMSGAIANLTGMAIQSRASVTVPALFQGAPLEQSIPGLSTATTLLQGVGEAFNSIRQNGGFDGQEMAEILSIYGVNGTLKHGMQWGLDYSVDRRRNVISNDIRSFENSIPRIFELKSVREKRKFDQLQKERMHNQIKKNHLDRLKKAMRADFRSGDLNSETFESHMEDYYKATGSVDYYKRFFKQQLLSAKFDKFSRKFIELAKKSSDAGDMQRWFELQAEDKD